MDNDKKTQKLLKKSIRKTSGIFAGFRDFILRGNTIGLAVGVVLGSAFTALVTSIVNSVLNPLIVAIFGANDLASTLVFTLNGSEIKFGAVLSAILTFIIVAATVYFVIVIPVNKLNKVIEPGDNDFANKESAEDILKDIRELLREE